VVLNSGKVKLNVKGKEEIYMEPGDWVEYSVKTHVYERKQINPEKYTSWRNNVLTFDESTLGEIATVLEDTYGLEIFFKDPEIAAHRFTTTLPTDQIEILFPMLEESFNLKIIRNGKQITIENAPDDH
jgi:ferric-dicitrate binding protein FerR (iron transport regulator)